jgi:hypothetical protein
MRESFDCWDLSPFSQNVAKRRLAPPRHSGRWVVAPVASLRCRILRPGDSQYKLAGPMPPKTVCTTALSQGINTLVLVLLRWPFL